LSRSRSQGYGLCCRRVHACRHDCLGLWFSVTSLMQIFTEFLQSVLERHCNECKQSRPMSPIWPQNWFPCICATTAEKLEGTYGHTLVDVNFITFPFPSFFAFAIIRPPPVLHSLSFCIHFTPITSSSIPCGLGCSPTSNEKLGSL